MTRSTALIASAESLIFAFAVSPPLTSMRGWWIASDKERPPSTIKDIFCMTAGMIRRPPDAPRAKLKPSVRRTIVGHMLQRGRLPPPSEFGPPGRVSNHMIPLFIRIPVSGRTTLLPNALNKVWVNATMLPSPSMVVRCVVHAGSRTSSASPIVARRVSYAAFSAAA